MTLGNAAASRVRLIEARRLIGLQGRHGLADRLRCELVMSTILLCKDCRWAALDENESGMASGSQ